MQRRKFDDLLFRKPDPLHSSVPPKGPDLNLRGGKTQWQVKASGRLPPRSCAQVSLVGVVRYASLAQLAFTLSGCAANPFQQHHTFVGSIPVALTIIFFNDIAPTHFTWLVA